MVLATPSGSQHEPAHERPIAFGVDVAVGGGGLPGVFAAFTAARQGLAVVLVERMPVPGGNIGPGMNSQGSFGGAPIRTLVRGGVAGITREFQERVEHAGGFTVHPGDHEEHCNRLTSHACSHVALKMLEEAGVQLLMPAFASDPILEGDRGRGTGSSRRLHAARLAELGLIQANRTRC